MSTPYPATPVQDKTKSITLKSMVNRVAKAKTAHLGLNAPNALGAKRLKMPKSSVLRAMKELQVTEQMREYAKLKLQIRDRLKAIGVPIFSTKAPKGSEAYEALIQSVSVEINKLVVRYMTYEFDENLKIDELINLSSDQLGYEIWVSKWAEFLTAVEKKKARSVKDDCDGYTSIFLILAWAAGIPVERLAFGVVISESGLVDQKRVKLQKKQFDHAIGLYFAFGEWWCGGDTWQQDTLEYKCKVMDRHLLYLYGLFDEGFRFRYSDTFKNLKPLGVATTRGRPRPELLAKKSVPQ